jgi:uncharacterized protein (UPF0332 family)
MRSRTHAGRLINVAQKLLIEGPRSAAFRRRAISTAYYAVFHAIAKICADYITRSASRTSEDYLRVYRSLDHKPLKNAFKQPPLKDNDKLKRLGVVIVRLQAERHNADYLPPLFKLFPLDEAQEIVAQAEQAVAELESFEADGEEAKLLALSLLFRERQS